MTTKSTRRKDSKGRVLRDGEDQLKDGRYRYRYQDICGRHAITSWRLVETDAVPKGGVRNNNPPLRVMEESILRRKLNGLDTYKAQKVTLNEYFERYMETKAKVLRPTTSSNYRYSYDHAARNTIGLLPIGKISYSTMRDFYFSLILEQEYAPRSIEVLHTILRPIFELARKDDIISKNPCDAIQEVKQSCDWSKKARHALTEEQQAAFIDFYNQHSARKYRRWRPVLTTLFGSGMRIGETIGLRWCDVDFEKNIIDVNHELVYYKQPNGKCGFCISPPKTKNGYRTIPMLPDLRDVLEKEYERQKGNNAFCTSVIEGYTGFIFTGRFNQVISRASVNRAIERIRNDYNAAEKEKAKKEKREPLLLPHFSVHSIRHSFASRVVENDALPAKLLQELMGHADISTTMNIYAEFSSSKKKQELTINNLHGIIKIT